MADAQHALDLIFKSLNSNNGGRRSVNVNMDYDANINPRAFQDGKVEVEDDEIWRLSPQRIIKGGRTKKQEKTEMDRGNIMATI